MRKYLKNYLTWIFIWAWFLTVLFVWLFILKARQTTNPGLTDTSPDALYVTNWETLTATKRNNLVAKRWLTDLQVINCKYDISNGWSTWRHSRTRINTDYWWDLPSNYSNCYYASNWKLGNSPTHYCVLTGWYNRQGTASDPIRYSCNYLCRNE